MSTATETRQALPTGTWSVDPVHSHVGFAVDYMVGTFRGSFSPVDAKLEVTDDGRATLSGKVPVTGVKVQDEALAAHLQSPEFFDAERTPEVAFVANEIVRSGDEITVRGELTIKGTSHALEARGTVTDPADDAFGGVRFALNLEATVDRTQFGLNWNNPLPNGEPALANDVTITTELVLVRS